METVEEQQAILDFCTSLKTKDFILNNDVRCWTDSFDAYLSGKGKKLPINDPVDFKEELWSWASTT